MSHSYYNDKLPRANFIPPKKENGDTNENIWNSLKNDDFLLNRRPPKIPTMNVRNPNASISTMELMLETPNRNATKNTIINVDSRNRNIIPTNVTDNTTIRLTENPIISQKDSNELRITVFSNHQLKIGDRIVIQNVKGRNARIQNSMIFIRNSKFVKIMYPHLFEEDYDTYVEQYVDIKNLVGNKINQTYVENIPVNAINKLHKIHLTMTDLELPSKQYFYIELPIKFMTEQSSGVMSGNEYHFTNSFDLIPKYLHGIPLKRINTNYPLDNNHSQGNHLITNVGEDYIIIRVDVKAVVNDIGGGKNVMVTKVLDHIEAYDSPSIYTIALSRTFYNVSSLRIVSSEFPNTNKLIRSKPLGKKNNMFYWQNLKDGDTIYSVEITPGNYSITGLVDEFVKQIAKTTRQNNALNQLFVDENTAYGNNNIIDITIDTLQNLIEFSAFEEIILKQPFTFIEDETGTVTTVRVRHLAHNLSLSDEIIVQNAKSSNNVPSSILNDTHVITKIIDTNSYEIELKQYNPALTNIKNNGGNAVSVYVPLVFRILCNYEDSITKILGFNDVGKTFAITKFNTKITNQEPYDIDLYTEEEKTIKEVQMNLDGENYFLMKCNDFKGLDHVGSDDNYFSKIQIPVSAGEVMYDAHLDKPMIFETPLSQLSELNLSFHFNDGTLFDFNNQDHSFSLMISESVVTHDQQSSYNSKTGASIGRSQKLINNDRDMKTQH